MNILGIDSNIVIIVASNISRNGPAIRQLVADADLLLVSTLVVGETLVRPLRHKSEFELSELHTFFDSPAVRLIDVDNPIARRAAALRADFNLQLIDAIHLATALESGGSRFLTTDKHFERCIGKLPIDIIRTDP